MSLQRPERTFDRIPGALRVIGIFIGAGFLGVVVFALQGTSAGHIASIASVGFLVGGASLFVGGLLGFLFGIPRTVLESQSGPDTQDIDQTESSEGGRRGIGFQANTNLEQISDWLTKILVGVGLTQLSGISEGLRAIAEYVAPGLGNFASSLAFGMAILVFFLVCGFLFSFLWTRAFLGPALHEVEQATLRRLSEQVNTLNDQAAKDADAISLTEKQLSDPDFSELFQVKLTNAVRAATEITRIQIYSRVHDFRRQNWKTDKKLMERVIPIFRALTKSGQDRHEYHGQLGFALKDKESPDWPEAKDELDKAIALRGDWQDNGWLFYELNRAICGIQLGDSRNSILEDLRAAAQNDFLRDIIKSEDVFKKWMSKNQVTLRNLR